MKIQYFMTVICVSYLVYSVDPNPLHIPNALLEEHGILVSSPHIARTINSFHHVYVLLKKPHVPAIAHQLSVLESHVNALDQRKQPLRREWLLRIQDTKHLMQFAEAHLRSPESILDLSSDLISPVTRASHNRRERRGLFDGVGWGLNFLFGTGMESSYENLESMVDNLNLQVDVVDHREQQFASFVNVSRHVISENRNEINTLNKHLENITDVIRQLQTVIANKDMRTAMEEKITYYLTLYHVLAADFEKRAGQFAHRRTVLQMGHITSDILPENELETLSLKSGFSIPSPLWLYRFCSIEFVSTTKGQHLIFEARLPLLTNEIFHYYRIFTFNVNYKNNITRRLKTSSEIAVSMLSFKL